VNDPTQYNSVETDISRAQKHIFFITCRSACPLIFSQRLGWSYLVKCHKTKKTGTQIGFSEMVGFRRDRCKRVFDKLIDKGLASRPHYRAFAAKKPTHDHAEWFVTRKTDSDDWADRLAYFPVPISAERSIVDDVLLALVRSLAGNQVAAENQSHTGLATMLGCSWKTVKQSLARLEQGGCLELIPAGKTRFKNMERFDLILKVASKEETKPLATKRSSALNAEQRKPDEEAVPSDREICMQHLYASKIPYRLASEIVHLLFTKYRCGHPLGVMFANLEDAQAKHNGKANHPGFLLKHMIQGLIDKQQKEWRMLMDLD